MSKDISFNYRHRQFHRPFVHLVMVCVPPISESSPFDSSPAGSDTGILACLQTAKIQVE